MWGTKRFSISHNNINKEVVGTLAGNSVAQNECLAAHKCKYSAYKIQASENLTSEVLSFVDTSDGDVEKIHYVSNPIASSDAANNTSLAGFLSRPTLIDSRAWTTSDSTSTIGTGFEPWYQFLNNSVIKQKLTNYSYLRGKLCLKFVINATPFHFGLLRVAYEPNVNYANTGSRKSMVRSNPTSDFPLLVPYSQLPGVWIHPADNSGGHLELPFFKENNWLSLQTAAEAKTMGVLVYFVTAILGIASSTASTSVTIDTFAWMEDVELCAATAELTLQGKDEYDGPVSSVASAVASATRSLEHVPVIGKFARATTIGASAIADIASMFGFTNTPVIENHRPITNMAGPVLATSEIGAPIQKLTLDPKQELSVDPSLHGVSNKDEMIIQNIVSKPSVLTVTTWATGNAIGVVLFNARVSPMLFQSVDILNTVPATCARRVYHTPLSYIGMMFAHWRGDIIFDFEVVCTKFHKGRLKISWDPVGTTGTAALAENVVYTTILDIGETNKASLRIPYHSAYAFLKARSTAALNYSAGTTMSADPTSDNGLLLVSVLTPLVSPVSPQTLSVVVSVRGADNLEYVNPKDSLGESSTGAPPSFFAVQGKDEIDIEEKEVNLGDTGSMHPHRYALNFGESVTSLRALAHRMSLYDVSAPGAHGTTRFGLYEKSYARLPPMYGYDPNGQSTASKIKAASGSTTFTFTPTHPMTYIAMMYGAYRGGVNFTANPSVDLYPHIGDIRVQRLNTDTDTGNRRGRITSSLNTGTTASVTRAYLNDVYYFTAGGAFTNSESGGAISWNAPHMGMYNFNFCDPTYSVVGNPADGTDKECTVMNILVKQATASTITDSLAIATYAGSGVDWHCIWWLVCPTLDYYTSKPAGV